MRKFSFFFISIFLLTACSSGHNFEYEDFLDNHIQFQEILSVKKDYYYVYIYTFWCGHCKKIKQEVLKFADKRRDSFFLIEYTSDIPSTDKAEETLGATTIEDVRIIGTPTLLVIENSALTSNIAGANNVISYLNNI